MHKTFLTSIPIFNFTYHQIDPENEIPRRKRTGYRGFILSFVTSGGELPGKIKPKTY